MRMRYQPGSTVFFGQMTPFTRAWSPKYSGTQVGWTSGFTPAVTEVVPGARQTALTPRALQAAVPARGTPAGGVWPRPFEKLMLPSSLKARSWMAKKRSYLGMPSASRGSVTGSSQVYSEPAGCAGSRTGKNPAGPAITLWWVLPRVWSWNQIVASSWTIGYV